MNKTLRFSLLSLLIMLCGTLFAQEPSISIVFKDTGTGNDSSKKQTAIADIIDEGADYVSAIPTATQVYNGRQGRGLKLGSGSANAQLVLTLAEVVKPTKITFDAMWYKEGEQSITVNGNNFTELTSTVTTYTIDYDGNTEVSQIEISTPEKRAYITNVKIYASSTAGGDNTVQNYTVDFNTAITTSDRDFAVASNWGHIVDSYEDYWGDPAYVSYTYVATDGVDGTGALRVSTNQKKNNIYDLLVTPVVSGTVTLYVKPYAKYYNDSAFLEFWSLNEDGTAKNAVLATTNFSERNNTEEWDWTPLTITLDEPQRIGIRASEVYFDNFSATAAEIVPQPILRVTGVMNADGQSGMTGTNPLFNQNAEGNTEVSLKVKLENTGDVDFVAGVTENYTLTLAEGTTYSVSNYFEDAPFAIPVNLAKGETAVVDAAFTVPVSVGYNYFYVRENVTGKTSSSYRYAQVKEYASKFIFDVAGTSYYSSSSATTKAISLGKITETTTVNYEIYNPGSAPLVINSFAVPAGYTTDAPEGEFTVAAGEKKPIAITLSADNFGIFAGNIVIAYTNFGKEQTTYTLPISGTVVDSSKNFITFDNGQTGEAMNGQFPNGSIHSDQVYISSKTDGDVTNYYLQSTSTVTKFITPLLTAAAGESFTYDVWYSGWSGSSSSVTVYSSTDRVNWTQIDKQTYSSGIGSAPTTFTATIAEAGNYYLAFELGGSSTMLDNIYGLTLAPEADHDWYLLGSNVPATGKQNKDYTATVSLKNISAVADEIVTATLFVGGEAVAVLNNVELPANDKTAAVGTGRNGYSNIEDPTEVSFTFKPHTIGTLPVFIELTSGQTTLKTNAVDVTFDEEKVESDKVAEAGGTSPTSLLHMNWNNSETVTLYTADNLANNYGLEAGDKIQTITFRGYKTSKDYDITLSAWYELTDDQTQAVPAGGKYNTEGMTQITSGTVAWMAKGSESELADLIVLTLPEPVTYEAGKSLRLVVCSEASTYAQTYFEVSKVSGTDCSFYNRSDNYEAFATTVSWGTNSYAPLAHFGLLVEPTYYTGTVTDGIDPVAGAVVTLTSADEDDVQYTGTTAEDGTFQIAVIQDKKTYNVSVTAAGYPEAATAEGVTFPAEAATFTLAKPAGYLADFNTEITTSNHDFRVASGWKHIVDSYDDGYSINYINYSYKPEDGIDGTGALQANRQLAGDNWDNKVTYDLLVTPLVQGQVKLSVKPTTMASSSAPAFVEYYTLNADGTAREALIERFSDLEADVWTPVTITVTEEQRIGIRAQYVLMDDFTATTANIVPEPALTIISVKDVNDANTTYFDAKEDGSYTVEYKVVVKNTGDLALVAGETENYSLSVFNRYQPAVKYGEFAIPFNLAVGQTSDEFVMTVDIPAGEFTGWAYRDVIENVSGTTAQGRWSNVNAYEPKFVFAAAEGTSSLYGDIAFGKITADSTQTFDIYNDGTALLQVKSITVPEGFTLSDGSAFTLAKKERKSISITLPAATPGIYTGQVEVVYVDKNGADQTFTKAISGTVLDASKNTIIFSDADGNAAYPAGSVRFGTYISGDSENRYLQGTNKNPLFITPLMTAEAGEQIAFDAQYTSWSGSSVVVKTSTDRQNWTTIATVDNIASSYNWSTYTATIAEAGNYYIGFELNNARIDNIYGLVYAPVADHDWLLVKSELPAAATQNALYTATAALGNVGPNAEEAGAYTATLYVGDEAVATAESVALPVANISGNYNNADEENYTTFSFSFRPHTVGTLPAYIEFKADGYSLTTPVADVTVAEEVLMSELQIGDAKSTSSSVPFYSSWMDDAAGVSMSDVFYSPEQLAAFGLKQGDKITAIRFVGTPRSTKDITSLTAEAWVAQQAADAFVAGNVDKEQMTHVTLMEGAQSFQDGTPVDFTIDLSASPLVYDGTSAIRLLTNINGNGQYVNISFATDNAYSTAYYLHGSQTSWSSDKVPVALFSLAVEPVYLSGTVTAGQSKVAGAQVSLVSTDGDDIQYAALTDAEGAYSINVIQSARNYRVTVTAEGYQEAAATVEMAGQSQTLDFVLRPDFVPVDEAKSLLTIDPADGSKNRSLQIFTLSMVDGTGVQDIEERDDKAVLTNTTTGTTYEVGITTAGVNALLYTDDVVTELGEYTLTIPAGALQRTIDEALFPELQYSFIIEPAPLFETGKYYLANVGAKMCWGAGNDWGTRASLVEHPEYVTLHVVDAATNTYTIESQVSNGGEAYYFEGDYMDNANAKQLTIAQLENGTYTISADGKYYGYDGTSTVLGKDVDPATDNGQWFILTDEQLLSKLVEATQERPMDATWFILDPNFGRNNRNAGAWQKVEGNPNLSGGNNVNNNAESYMAAFEIAQTLNDVPNGIYKLEAQAAVTFHDNRTIKEYDGNGYPVVFAGSASSDFVEMSPADQLSSQSKMSEQFTAGNYSVEPLFFEVTDGTIRLGAKSDRADIWAVWDNFELTYFGPDADITTLKFGDKLNQLADLREQAEALKGEVEVAAVTKALNDALTATANVEQTAAAIDDALATLTAAVDKGQASVKAKSVLPQMKELTESTNFYTQEAYDTYYGNWEAKYEAGTLTKSEADALQDPFLVTGWHAAITVDNLLLSVWDTNPDFVDAPYYINTWSTEGIEGSGNYAGAEFGVPFFEYWTGDDSSLGEKTLTATLTGLQPGVYNVGAQVRVRGKNSYEAPAYGITMQVCDGQAVDVTAGQQVGTSQFYLDNFTAKGTVAADGVLTLKFQVAADNNISWLSFKNVKYAYDDVATGILTVGSRQNAEGVYSISGQKVEKTRKGLYIQNGKKVVIK